MKNKLISLIAICSGFTLFLSAPVIAGDQVDKEAYIDCTQKAFNSLEPNDQSNEVYAKYKITWYAHGPKYTHVKIEFVKKNTFCKDVSPFDSTTGYYEKDIKKDYGFTKIDSDKVKDTSTDSCYTYKITCTLPNGDVKIMDPIIDVPK